MLARLKASRGALSPPAHQQTRKHDNDSDEAGDLAGSHVALIAPRESEPLGTCIVALPAAVAHRVRGGSLVPDFGSHMLQLMYNALDAKASSISVKICFNTFTLSVRDDGHGMTFDDLRHCGERSFTSKMRDISQLRDVSFSSYGYRGESLAAISEFCHMEILSRSRARPAETCRKVLKSGENATVTRVLDSSSIGTTVTCRDLFYNRPVARKMMSAQDSIHAPEASDVSRMQALLMLVRALAAIHPDVGFTVYEGARIQPILSLPKCAGMRQAFSRISKTISPQSLFHVGLSYGSYRIKALLCPPSFSTLPRTKDAQLVYVNGRLCVRGLVHKRMNRVYKEVWEQQEPDLMSQMGDGGLGSGGTRTAMASERPDQIHFPQKKRRRGEEGSSLLAPTRRFPVFLVRIRSCEREREWERERKKEREGEKQAGWQAGRDRENKMTHGRCSKRGECIVR